MLDQCGDRTRSSAGEDGAVAGENLVVPLRGSRAGLFWFLLFGRLRLRLGHLLSDEILRSFGER